jgi:hypothetical protein
MSGLQVIRGAATARNRGNLARRFIPRAGEAFFAGWAPRRDGRAVPRPCPCARLRAMARRHRTPLPNHAGKETMRLGISSEICSGTTRSPESHGLDT